jgi:hypothetical protein
VANIGRILASLMFLGGSVIHFVLALVSPQSYANFGKTALIPTLSQAWDSIVMPNTVLFVLLLAAFELTTGILLLTKGRFAKTAAVCSLLFNLFLITLGMGLPQADLVADIMNNRIYNIIWGAWQVPLLFVAFDKSIPELITARFRSPRRQAA